ncbi:transposon Ty3-I Gag-Pol polyprotein [Trichonephila clavata]|uniref:Transposon Ty3-I Gag-Pol polyprotein n=1 Tax=Trichonephila clavata TaxID=2740835 RepID=A0A8X6G694_TRICU|nr:transposon Ty3-I Gag-Pol polyprotein [Trichonephila clavata]
MLVDVLQEYSEAFKERKNGSLSPKFTVKHRINTGDNLPVKQRAYRVSPAEHRIIHDEVGKMFDRGIIQPSESMVISCQLDDTLDSLQGSKFFSSIDLSSGYWQIEVDEADREKTDLRIYTNHTVHHT